MSKFLNKDTLGTMKYFELQIISGIEQAVYTTLLMEFRNSERRGYESLWGMANDMGKYKDIVSRMTAVVKFNKKMTCASERADTRFHTLHNKLVEICDWISEKQSNFTREEYDNSQEYCDRFYGGLHNYADSLEVLYLTQTGGLPEPRAAHYMEPIDVDSSEEDEVVYSTWDRAKVVNIEEEDNTQDASISLTRRIPLGDEEDVTAVPNLNSFEEGEYVEFD